MDTSTDNVEARVMRVANGISLVEWTDAAGVLQRSWVTEDMIQEKEGNHATVIDPGAGVPFGVPFAQIVEFSADPKEFERELHKRGIWTTEDVRNNLGAVRNALIAAYSTDVREILRSLERYEQELASTEDN